MNSLALLRDPTLLSPAVTRRSASADVEAVAAAATQRARESIVAVRVQVVTNANERPETSQPVAAEARDEQQTYSRESAQFFARLQSESATAHWNATDAQRAAAAYTAHADWRGYGASGASAPPALLSRRA